MARIVPGFAVTMAPMVWVERGGSRVSGRTRKARATGRNDGLHGCFIGAADADSGGERSHEHLPRRSLKAWVKTHSVWRRFGQTLTRLVNSEGRVSGAEAATQHPHRQFFFQENFA